MMDLAAIVVVVTLAATSAALYVALRPPCLWCRRRGPLNLNTLCFRCEAQRASLTDERRD